MMGFMMPALEAIGSGAATAGGALGSAAGAAGSALGSAGGAIGDAIGSGASTLGNAAKDVGSSLTGDSGIKPMTPSGLMGESLGFTGSSIPGGGSGPEIQSGMPNTPQPTAAPSETMATMPANSAGRPPAIKKEDFDFMKEAGKYKPGPRAPKIQLGQIAPVQEGVPASEAAPMQFQDLMKYIEEQKQGGM